MAKVKEVVEESPVRLDLLRAFKRIKAFAQINVESLNKKQIESEAISADLERIKRSLASIEELLKYVD